MPPRQPAGCQRYTDTGLSPHPYVPNYRRSRDSPLKRSRTRERGSGVILVACVARTAGILSRQGNALGGSPSRSCGYKHA